MNDHEEGAATFECLSCGEPVPVGNKLMHSIQCQRHSRPEHPPSPSTQSSVAKLPPTDPPSAASTANEPTQRSAVRPPSPLAPSPSAAAPLARCEFCDIDVPLKALGQHAFECGNRTDVCEACSSYVRLCDFARHRESGCGVGATTTTGRARGAAEEATPLIGAENGDGEYHQRLVREQEAEMPGWAPAVVAVAGVCAALAFAFMRRRAF